MEKMKIKGEYEYNICFDNMFGSHKVQMKKSNLITNDGLDFFITRMVEDTAKITKLGFGTSSTTPAKTDTTLTNSVEVTLDDLQKSNDGITLTATTTGSNLNGKCEIGAIAIDTSDNTTTLISRSVHSALVLPVTATVTVEYYFKINN